MNGLNTFLDQNLLIIITVLLILILILLILSVLSIITVFKLKKRYETFTGSKRRPGVNIEAQFAQFHNNDAINEERYEKIYQLIKDMDKTVKKCVQKVGIVRYNPFDEVGGNLSYAIAILDGENNGIVLNGIHSRSGSFTYAKPIILGISEYALSKEELQAIEMAMDNSYNPELINKELEKLDKKMPINKLDIKEVPNTEDFSSLSLEDILASTEQILNQTEGI